MSKKEMEKMVMELKELESFRDEIEAEIEAKKDALKDEMVNLGKEEVTAGIFKVRYKRIASARFDSKRFKADHAEMYEEYKTETSYMKFSIA